MQREDSRTSASPKTVQQHGKRGPSSPLSTPEKDTQRGDGHSSPSSSSDQQQHGEGGPFSPPSWSRKRRSQRDRSSPRQTMSERRVDKETTHVLLGDSVMVPIDPRRMYPGARSQNLGVPGLSIEDLMHWLSLIPACPQVRVVAIHVGINTCNKNTITSREWSGLLKLTKKVFRNAVITASTIVPPKGYHPLTKTVRGSNEALKKSCDELKLKLADNTELFSTASGAPRKALYRDCLHPSYQGTARLACNIKGAYSNHGGYRSQRRPPSGDVRHVGEGDSDQSRALGRDGRNSEPPLRSKQPVFQSWQPHSASWHGGRDDSEPLMANHQRGSFVPHRQPPGYGAHATGGHRTATTVPFGPLHFPPTHL